jgi:hypothetical protein
MTLNPPDDDAAEWFRTQLRQSLTAATRNRDSYAVAALRTPIAAVDNGEALPPPIPSRGRN